jgi:hypothetical protein
MGTRVTSNERRFAVRTAVTPDWMRATVDALRSHAGKFHYFSGKLNFKIGGIRSLDHDDEASWRAALDERWSQVEEASLWADGPEVQFRLRVTPPKADLALQVTASTEESVETVFRDLRNRLALEPTEPNQASPDHEQPRRAMLQRRFISPAGLTADRVIAIVDSTLGAAGKLERFSGNLGLAHGSNQRLEYENIDAWRAALKEHWANLAETVVWVHGSERRWYLVLDTKRAILTVEASGAEQQECQRQLDAFRDALALADLADDPYRYRRASASYRIRSWNRKEFAAGLARIIENLSPGSDPSLGEAYVAIDRNDRIERLLGFHSAAGLINFLEKEEQPFHRLGFSFEGVAGEHLGLYLDVTNVSKATMEVLASYPPERLAELVSPLAARLDLKLIEGQRRGSSTTGESASPVEPWWIKHIVAIAVAALAAMVGVATVGLQVVQALRADYELKLRPPLAENAEFRTTDREVAVDWYLKPTNTLFQDLAYGEEAAATLKIFKEGTTPIERDPQAPPIRLRLGPGKYVVEIVPLQQAEPKSFRIDIVAAPARR